MGAPGEVRFQRLLEPAIGWNDPDNVDPYISMAFPDGDIADQLRPFEIVIPLQHIRVMYKYPLRHPTTFRFTADTRSGFTRAHLAHDIARGYARIYAEEERAVGNPGHIPGKYNRASSDGPYGIWGHDLNDLVLRAVVPMGGDLFGLTVDS